MPRSFVSSRTLSRVKLNNSKQESKFKDIAEIRDSLKKSPDIEVLDVGFNNSNMFILFVAGKEGAKKLQTIIKTFKEKINSAYPKLKPHHHYLIGSSTYIDFVLNNKGRHSLKVYPIYKIVMDKHYKTGRYFVPKKVVLKLINETINEII